MQQANTNIAIIGRPILSLQCEQQINAHSV